MPRIIVTAESSSLPNDLAVWLDEEVGSVHMSTGHAAAQLLERIGWAISDAEDSQRKPARRWRPRSPTMRAHRLPGRTHAGAGRAP